MRNTYNNNNITGVEGDSVLSVPCLSLGGATIAIVSVNMAGVRHPIILGSLLRLYESINLRKKNCYLTCNIKALTFVKKIVQVCQASVDITSWITVYIAFYTGF